VTRTFDVPTASQHRALDDLLAWAEFEAPPVQDLRGLGVDARLVNALLRNDIRFLDQLHQLAEGVKEHYASGRLSEVTWYLHFKVLGRKLDGIGPKLAATIVPAWDAWAQAEPQQAALIVAYRSRRPNWRAKQMVLAFLLQGLKMHEIATLYGVSNQRVHQVLESAGLHSDLRDLHRINRKWAQVELDRHDCKYLAVRGMGKCDGHNSFVQLTDHGQPVGEFAHVCDRHRRVIEEGWDETGTTS
jgi:hypothetical protein